MKHRVLELECMTDDGNITRLPLQKYLQKKDLCSSFLLLIAVALDESTFMDTDIVPSS